MTNSCDRNKCLEGDTCREEENGSFICLKFDSNIVETKDLQSELIQLCRFSEVFKWRLVYRGTRDGFSAYNFHSRCNWIANTLTIVQSETNNIFGGFTTKPWTFENRHIADPNAFVFSLRNNESNPFLAGFVNGGKCLTTALRLRYSIIVYLFYSDFNLFNLYQFSFLK